MIIFEASPLRPPCRPGTRPGPAPVVSPHRQGPSSAPQTPFSPGEEDFEAVCPPQSEEGVSGSQGNPRIQRRAFAPSGGEVTMARRGGDGHPSTEEATARHRHASGATSRRGCRANGGTIQWSGLREDASCKVHLAAGPTLWCAPLIECDRLQRLVLAYSRLVRSQSDAYSSTWTC